MNTTALGAATEKDAKVIFISEAHEKFDYEKLKEVRYQNESRQHNRQQSRTKRREEEL